MYLSVFILVFCTLLCCVLAIRHYLYSKTYGPCFSEYVDAGAFLLSGKVLFVTLACYFFLSGSFIWIYFNNKEISFAPLFWVYSCAYFMHLYSVNTMQELLFKFYLEDCYLAVSSKNPIKKRFWAGKSVDYFRFSILNGKYDLMNLENAFDYFEDVIAKVNHEDKVRISFSRLHCLSFFGIAIAMDAFLFNGYKCFKEPGNYCCYMEKSDISENVLKVRS